MTTWTNEDGLLVRFNTSRSDARTDGVVGPNLQMIEVGLPDATALGDTDTAAALADAVFIPAGATILRAHFVVDTAFTSGGSAVLDIGLKQADGTNIDDDGVDAALAVAALTVRTGVACDGALVTDKMQYDSYVMFTYDTAAFTAGAGRLFIEYIV